MGSWVELDAIYPPGALTPAAALLVALGHLEGADSVFGADGRPAGFLPRRGIAYDADLLGRAERWLREVPLDAFLAEAAERLGPERRRIVLLNMLDRAAADGTIAPAAAALIAEVAAALGIPPDELAAYRRTLMLKNDLGAFPQ